MGHLDLTIAKESKRTESALCATSGKTFGKETVLTASLPKQTVVLSVGSINIEQRVVEKTSVENKNNNSTYEIHHNTKEKVILF